MPRTTYEMKKDEAKRIGQRTKWARELAGLTPTELAADIGVDSTVIRVIERGARLPSLHVMMAICHVLRVSPQYLLWGSLEAVNPELAALLIRAHPELLRPAAPASRLSNDSEPPYSARRPRIRLGSSA